MKVVAVLGGGGAKAVAHVGAWRALEEAGMKPAAVVGTSMGAVIGAALASGRARSTIERRVRDIAKTQIAVPNPVALVTGLFSDGLLLASPLRNAIAKLVPHDTFDELALPFLATLTDLQTGALVLCGGRAVAAEHPEVADGFPLPLALEASCSLPVYYPDVTIFGRRYADGGLRAVLPVAAARLFAPDLVVAVHVGPGFDEVPAPGGRTPIPPLVRAHGEAVRILMAEQTDRALEAWPADGPRLLVVRAVNETEATFAGGNAGRYLEMGYEATRRALAS